MTPIVFDVEASGLKTRYSGLDNPVGFGDYGDEIIQLGGLVLDNRMLPIKAFCHYCDMVRADSGLGALETHNIHMEDIRSKLSGVFVEELITTRCLEMLCDDTVFIGYNSEFDLRMTYAGMCNLPGVFKPANRVTTRIQKNGRQFVDLMAYYPDRRKLVTRVSTFDKEREEFFKRYGHKLPLDTNMPDLFISQWGASHNALWDVIDTYLLFYHEIWRKKLF